jgi:hypothetical protein
MNLRWTDRANVICIKKLAGTRFAKGKTCVLCFYELMWLTAVKHPSSMPELLAAKKAGDCAGRYLTAIAIGRRVSKGNGRWKIYGSDSLPVRRAQHIPTRVYANAKNAASVQMIIVIIHRNLRI